MDNTYELLRALGGKPYGTAPGCFGKAFRQAANQYREMTRIAKVMAKAGRPMRVKEICAALDGDICDESWDYYSHVSEINKYVHCLRLMRRAGLVIRTEVEGDPIEVENAWYFGGPENPGTHTITPKIAFYSLPFLD